MRPRHAISALSAVAALAGATAPAARAAVEDELRLAAYSPAQPAQLSGGKSPPYKPDNWEDTRYLEVTAAMTLRQGNVMMMEGFVFPEPGAPLCNLGGFRVEGMKPEGTLAGRSTVLRATLDYGGGTRVHLNRVCPGLMIETAARQLDLFTSERISVQAWRVSGAGPSRPPAYLAIPEAGQVRVVRAVGQRDLAKMDQPWLIAFWAGAYEFDIPTRPAGGGPHRNIWPIYPADSDLRVRRGAGEWPSLIVLQKRARKVVFGQEGWSFHFEAPAGKLIVAPLYGRKWLAAEQIAAWKDALPKQVVEHARLWASRLRQVPVDVTETQSLLDGVPTFVEAFTHERIRDDWDTPPLLWAPIPPMFALARAMGFPVEGRGGKKLQDFGFLGRHGPLAGIDGSGIVSYRIGADLKTILGEAAAGGRADPMWPSPRPPGEAKAARLRRELASQIDKVLAAGELAPAIWTFGEMSASYYSTTYFHNPYETYLALIAALPHLEAGRAAKLREYLRAEYRRRSPFDLPYWGAAKDRRGARRERFPEDDRPNHWAPGANFNLAAIYAAWLYADQVAAADELPGIWGAAQKCLTRHRGRAGIEWDYTEPVRFPVAGTRLGTHMTHQNHPSVESRFESFNSRINGLAGYVRLARAAGDASAEEIGTCLLARALALRYAMVAFDQYLIEQRVHEPDPLPPPLCDAGRKLQSLTLLRGVYIGPRLAWTYIWKENTPAAQDGIGARVYFFHVHHPTWSRSSNGGGVSGGRDVLDSAVLFLGLDLEAPSAAFYRRWCRDFAALAMRELELIAPTWHMADGPTYFSSEEVVGPPELPWAAFLLKAEVLGASAEELYEKVDFPIAAVGDLYHIRKLAAALSAFRARDR